MNCTFNLAKPYQTLRCIRLDNQWNIFHFSESDRLNKNYFQSKSNQVHSLAISIHSNHMSLVLLAPLYQGYNDEHHELNDRVSNVM